MLHVIHTAVQENDFQARVFVWEYIIPFFFAFNKMNYSRYGSFVSGYLTKPPRTKPPRQNPPRQNPPETKPPKTKTPETKPPRQKPPRQNPPSFYRS